MQLTEFIHQPFFEQQYVRQTPTPALHQMVEFFWESRYDVEGNFAVTTFPRIGSALVFNLGNKLTLACNRHRYTVKRSAYYLRNRKISSYHSGRDRMFGIQFRVNLPLLSGSIQLSGQHFTIPRDDMFDILGNKLRQCSTFEERVKVAEQLITSLLSEKFLHKTGMVNTILDHCAADISTPATTESLGRMVFASPKTIERYFTDCIGSTPKQAIKIIRTRQALSAYCRPGSKFNFAEFGYYDESHFYKDLRQVSGG